jgi:hypothetical protein
MLLLYLLRLMALQHAALHLCLLDFCCGRFTAVLCAVKWRACFPYVLLLAALDLSLPTTMHARQRHKVHCATVA